MKKKAILAHSTCRLKAYDSEGIIVGTHSWGEQKLIGVFSMKGKPEEVEVELPDGVYTNLIDGSKVSVSGGKLQSGEMPVVVEFR